jgi:hypothetical protein
METITLAMIIINIISFLLHGFHLKSKFRCGSEKKCCLCTGEIEEDLTKIKNPKIPLSVMLDKV